MIFIDKLDVSYFIVRIDAFFDFKICFYLL